MGHTAQGHSKEIMRAILCTTFGGLDTLRLADLPEPDLMAGGIRIAVEAAGLNFADTLMIAGKYQDKTAPPFVPGLEIAGTVLEVAPGVQSCRPGDRVMAFLDRGGFAEQAVAREHDVLVLPDGIGFAAAAGFAISYGTSHFGLVDRARLQPGDTLLVHGAASGVGLTAVEVGAALGATVIATASGADRLSIAESRGARHLIDYRNEDIRERVKALTGGRGADVVYDPVGGAVFDASLRCTAPEGRILVVGFASGDVPQIPANHLLVKNVSVIGYWFGAYRTLAPDRLRASLQECLRLAEDGRLRPLVSAEYALEDAVAALQALKDRKVTGKIVLRVS
jgi:NADPH2:quinone reductase